MNPEVKHPVFFMRVDNSLRARKVWEMDLEAAQEEAGVVMGIGDETLDAWNPPLACFLTVGCPHCTLEDRHMSYHFSWTPEEPERTVCTFCGHAYPSKEHPLDEVTEVVSPAGTAQQYPYFPGKDGRRYYMESQLYNIRRFWLRQQAALLAHLYRETGETDYARKAGAIIRRFAGVYPEIPVHGPGELASPVLYEVEILPVPPDGVQPVPEAFGPEAGRTYDPPYPRASTRSGLWNRYPYDEVPLSLILAYDQVAGALEAADRGLIEDYFRQTVNYLRTYPHYLENYDPMQAKWEIVCGRVIGEPAFVHGGIARLKLMMQHVFYPDGMWCEGAPLYSSAVFQFLCDALRSVEGYRGREDGLHDAGFASEAMRGIAHVRGALEKMVVPDGSLASVYDTFGASLYTKGEKETYFEHAPPAESEPSLLWACGHAALGMGQGDHQVQARLQFMGSGTFSHSHNDRLSLQVFARGREMVSDIGYSQNTLRPYATCTFAHNLVMVDESSQFIGYSPVGGALIAYGDGHPRVQFVSVRAPQAYPQTREYRRSLVLVKVSEEDAYLVDLFEVKGGAQHDWLLHGDADRDSALVSELEMEDLEGALFASGETFRMWDSETGFKGGPGVRHPDNIKNALGMVRQVRNTRTDDAWTATFRPSPDDGTALRLWMMGEKGTEVFFGEMPSIRRAGDRNAELLDYWMPLVMARHKGENLESNFLAVHEPYQGAPFITSVSREGRALVVKTPGFTDVHLLGGGNETYEMAGCYGFLRVVDDAVVSAYLADGTRLGFGDFSLALPEAAEGVVLGVEGATLCLSGKVDLENAERIYLFFPGGQRYAIPVREVRHGDKDSVAVLAYDPRFTLSEDGRKGRLTAFPGEAFEGEVRYRVPRYGGCWSPT